MTVDQANTLRDWSKEYNLPFRGPEAHPGSGFGSNLISTWDRLVTFKLNNMKKNTFNLDTNVSADEYRRLLRFASEFCYSFVLVVRDTIELGPLGLNVLKSLNAFRLSKENKSEWPGTELFGHTAEVHSFRLSNETIAILEETSSNLFAWVQPNLPEDLCLIRSDGEPFFVTVAHEKNGYLILSLEEKQSLNAAIPNLRTTG